MLRCLPDIPAPFTIDRDSITANVHEGGKREAILHAVGANETHGLRRTNADRRQAVLLMLDDPEWRQWSDRDLASRCMVSHTFVNRIRQEMNEANTEPVTEEKRKYQRGGKTRTMRTKNIGAAKRRSQTEPEEASEIEQAAEVPTVNGLQLDSDAPATDIQSALTEPDVPAATVDHESAQAFDVPPEAPPTVEMRSGPDATTLPVEDAEKYSLSEAWEWADRAQREAFVVEHRSELKKIIAKIERREARSS
jgi:hypothetical protein